MLMPKEARREWDEAETRDLVLLVKPRPERRPQGELASAARGLGPEGVDPEVPPAVFPPVTSGGGVFRASFLRLTMFWLFGSCVVSGHRWPYLRQTQRHTDPRHFLFTLLPSVEQSILDELFPPY